MSQVALTMQVRATFEAKSAMLSALGRQGAYELRLARLYGTILPERCSVRVDVARRTVALRLHKKADAEWRHLKV